MKEIGGGTNPITVSWGLRVGASPVTSQTIISPVPSVYTTFTYTLSLAEKNLITDYNNLIFFVQANCNGSCANGASATEGLDVSWAELKIDNPPIPPVLTSATSSSPTTVNLVWTQPADISDVIQYQINKDGLPVGAVPVGTTTFQDIGLIPNTLYSYNVVSRGVSTQSIPSNTLQVTTQANPPLPPTVTGAVGTSQSIIKLTWTQPVDISNILEYRIFRDGVNIGTVPIGSTNFDDSGLTQNTLYSYFIISRGNSGQSIPSNTIMGTTQSGAGTNEPPVLVSAVAQGAKNINLSWTEPANTTGIAQYNIYRNDGTGFIILTTVPVGITSYSDFGLLPNILYSYYITSQGTSGESIPSNILSATTGTGSNDPPILNEITVIDATKLKVKWFEPIDTSQVVQYNVYRDSGAGFMQVFSVPVGSNFGIDTGLTQSTTYSYYVTSRGGFGESTPSNILTATTSSGVIDPPTLISAVPFNQFTLNLTWLEPADTLEIIQYEIFRSSNGINFFHVGAQPKGSTSFFDIGLMPNITYYYKMMSRGSTQSIFSNTISGLTASTLLPDPPFIVNAFSNGVNSITLTWMEPPILNGISSYEIERRVSGNGDFITVATIPVGTTTFTEIVPASTIFEYRVKSTDADGTGFPSNIFAVASSINPVLLNSTGFTIEPSPTNNFNDHSLKVFSQTAEMFVTDKTVIDQIINDIEIERLNAYKIIGKINSGQYGVTDEITNLGAFYGANYIALNNVTDFIDEIQDKARNARGGTNGAGDDPQHGVKEVGND